MSQINHLVKIFLILSCSVLLMVSCKNDRFKVQGKLPKTITIHRFDRDFQTKAKDIDSTFLNLYSTNIMEVDEPGSDLYADFYKIFHEDPYVKSIYDDCQKEFSDISKIETNLTWSFYRLENLFPKISVPNIYMHISCYGESIISAPGILSASIDKYLGKDYPAYKTLFQPYQSQRMYRDKIVSDYMTGWIRSEFTEELLLDQERLLDYLVYEGKILFLLKMVLPDETMENLTGFDKGQLKWCLDNEKEMWDSVLQLKQLYSTDRLAIAKYIEEAPYTSFFSKSSPGRALLWNGYKIVESYMKHNEKVKIQELMSNKDSQEILASSAFRP